MRICYDKLRKQIVDNKMKYCNLIGTAELSEYITRKINKNDSISMDKIMQICQVFYCDVGYVCEVILNESGVN